MQPRMLAVTSPARRSIRRCNATLISASKYLAVQRVSLGNDALICRYTGVVNNTLCWVAPQSLAIYGSRHVRPVQKTSTAETLWKRSLALAAAILPRTRAHRPLHPAERKAYEKPMATNPAAQIPGTPYQWASNSWIHPETELCVYATIALCVIAHTGTHIQSRKVQDGRMRTLHLRC